MNDHLNPAPRAAKMGRVWKNSVQLGARRFEIALLIGLMLIGPIMAFSYYSLRHLDEARKIQEHSLIVQDHLDDLRSAVRKFEIRYLRLAPEEAKGESRREIDTVLNGLSQSVEDDEIQTESLVEVRASIAEFVTDPTEERATNVKEWIDSMDAQEVEYLNEHRPAAIAFLSTASGSILIVGIMSLFLSILAFLGLRRQMRSREIIEDELRVAERQATLASEMKSKFLATISHEIRTPLNGIIAMADVLRASPLTAKDKRLTEIIFQSSQSLLRIINDLLNFSQIEAGQVGLEVEIFSVSKLVEQTCSVLELKAQQKSLKLFTKVADDVPQNLQGDGGRLGQVLFNLIGNAIKFTETGTVEVKVECDPASDRDVSRINFLVSDTGRGIPSEDMSTLFQPFNRLGKVGTSGEPGTGLGLSISQSLVRQMGGEIRVENRAGQGTIFWFQLPLKNVMDVEQKNNLGNSAINSATNSVIKSVAGPPKVAEHDTSHLEKSHLPNAVFKGVRVLVAEDNQTNQIVAQTVLEQLGCHVTLAQTGLEALETLASRDFDLVLMDCQMPVLDGYEATRRIRVLETNSARKPVRIVAMTANAQADDRARCLASGMDDYIRKPFVVDDLVRVLMGGDSTADLETIQKAMEELNRRLGSAPLLRIRAAFLKSLGEWPLEAHVLANNAEFLRELSHKLKSSSRTIGAANFADRLEQMEEILKGSENAATLDQTKIPTGTLKSELDRDVRMLKRLFAPAE